MSYQAEDSEPNYGSTPAAADSYGSDQPTDYTPEETGYGGGKADSGYGESEEKPTSYETPEDQTTSSGDYESEEKPSSYDDAQDTPTSYEAASEEVQPSSYDEQEVKPSSDSYDQDVKPTSDSYEEDVKPTSDSYEEDVKPSSDSYEDAVPATYTDASEDPVQPIAASEDSGYGAAAAKDTDTYQETTDSSKVDAYASGTPDEAPVAATDDDGLSLGEKIAIGVGATAAVAAVGVGGYELYEHNKGDDDTAAAVPAAPADAATDEEPPKKSSWF